MLTREQVSNLLIVGDVPYGNAHRLVLAHDAEQRQRIAELEAEVKDALECVYIPGVWACNQCEFQLIASNLYVQDGTIGPDTDTVPLCPNDGTLMRRVTWKERVSGLDKYAGERLNEIDTLKAEVARLTAMQLTHDAEQRQTIEAQALALNKALDDQYIPGVWSCTQCQFGLVSTYLYVNSGTASPDTDTMPMCPNDGSLLRRVIWKECVRSYDEYIERLLKEKEAQAQRIKELEAALGRHQEVSLKDVLDENRKVVDSWPEWKKRHQEEP